MGENPSEEQAVEVKGLWRGKGGFPCRNKNCEDALCNYWHLPVWQNYQCETGCNRGKIAISDSWRQSKKPSKKSKKGSAKGQAALRKEFVQLGCVSQKSKPRESILRKSRKIGIEARRRILQTHIALEKNSGKEGSIQRGHSESWASWA